MSLENFKRPTIDRKARSRKSTFEKPSLTGRFTEILTAKGREQKAKQKNLEQVELDRITRMGRTGYLAITRNGNGYVSTPHHGDVSIESSNLRTAFAGDLVTIKITKQREGHRAPKGEIVNIQHMRQLFVGDIQTNQDGTFTMSPQGTSRQLPPFTFTTPPPKNTEKGDKVLVKLKRWDNSNDAPEVEFVKNLGPSGTISVERDAIPYAFGFSNKFPEAALKEAEVISKTMREITPKEREWREDLTKIETVTIDPQGAGDIDDAFSVEALPNGNYRTVVYIADVSHYVKPGSEIDKEAERRGTSIYLPNNTIHMLPPVLASDLCSLNEGEERRSYAVIFEMTPKAKIVSRRIMKVLMRSDKQFSYKNAQETLDREIKRRENKSTFLNKLTYTLTGNTTETVEQEEYAETLYNARKLAQGLEKTRLANGAVEFTNNRSERQYQFNRKGDATQVSSKKEYDTQAIIAEFALAANTAAAEIVTEYYAGNSNFSIFRDHQPPHPEKILQVKKLLKLLESEKGSQISGAANIIPSSGLMTPQLMNKLFDKIDGTTHEEQIRMRLMRSMLKASYNTEGKGHFSLATKKYAQFTSPIRRLADIHVHRSLFKDLKKNKLSRADMDYYIQVAQIATERARNADSAQDDAEALENTEFMSQSNEMSRVRHAKVLNVNAQGLELVDTATGIIGMLFSNHLGSGWVFNREKGTYVHTKTKKQYEENSSLEVQVHDTDLKRRSVNWQIAVKGASQPAAPQQPALKDRSRRKLGKEKPKSGSETRREARLRPLPVQPASPEKEIKKVA